MAQQPEVTAAIIVIGDEILSGRTADKNINLIASFLAEHAINVKQARVIGDEQDLIVHTVNELRRQYDYIFTTGGIGPTHDDITADCIAKAFGVEIDLNPEALAMFADRYAKIELTPERLRMARIPNGASLIKNSASGPPGFRLGNVHVMAGIPQIVKAMLEDISPTLKSGMHFFTKTLDFYGGEGTIAGLLGRIVEEDEAVTIGSYPQMGYDMQRTQIVVRSTQEEKVKKAVAKINAFIAAHY